MPKNNFISQFFILNFAFLTNFALNRPVWNNTLSLSTWSPNESYHAVDQVIRATHRRPHISCSNESNLRQWNLLHDGVCVVETAVPLGYTRARAHVKIPERMKPCVLRDTSQHANFVWILSNERAHLVCPLNNVLGGSWILLWPLGLSFWKFSHSKCLVEGPALLALILVMTST